MKILYLLPSWGQPSELWALRMLEMLRPHVAVICTRDINLNLDWNNVPVISLQKSPTIIEKLKHKVGILLTANIEEERLSKIISDFKVDCLFIHFLSIGVYFENLINSINISTYIHCHGADITWDIIPHNQPGKRLYDKKYFNSVLKLGKNVRFIANSNFSGNKLIELGIESKRIFVKHLGVPVGNEYPRKPPKVNETINILYLGRLVDCKGPDLVIKAFELASFKGLKANLIIAGDGPLRTTCELLKARSEFGDRISILGTVDASSGVKLRASAHIFTAHNCKGPITNQEEAFGVSVVEAMADGLPVVSARSGALSETVINNETGVLVEPGNIEAHAEAFLKLYNDNTLRERMGFNSWNRVKELFSFEKEKGRMLELLACE